MPILKITKMDSRSFLLEEKNSKDTLEVLANNYNFGLLYRPRTTKELAEYLQCSPQTLEVMRCKGLGPAYLKFGRLVRYTERSIVDWVKESNIPSSFQNGGEL